MRRLVVVFAVVAVVASADLALLAQRVHHVSIDLPPPRPGSTYLLIGSDSRAFDDSALNRAAFGDAASVPGARADIVLVVHLPPTGKASLLAVPRDLVVIGPESAPTRLGLTLLQGPQSLVDALCGSLGIAADHLLMVDFAGFRRIVDALGGIDVDVSVPLRDGHTGIELSTPGVHHLDGSSALAYARSRRGEVLVDGAWTPEADGADGRTSRSRAVLSAAFAELGALLDSPLRLQRVAWAGSDALTVDDETGVRDLMRLGSALRAMAARGDSGVTIPVDPVTSRIPLALLGADAPAALAHVGVGQTPQPTEECSPGLLGAQSTIHSMTEPMTGGAP